MDTATTTLTIVRCPYCVLGGGFQTDGRPFRRKVHLCQVRSLGKSSRQRIPVFLPRVS